jgi:alkaline phosphatase D
VTRAAHRPLPLLLAGLLAAAAIAGAQATGPPILVTVGEVTATAAVVWARAPHAGRITVKAAADSGGSTATGTAMADRASDLTVKVPLTGLTAATRHRYRVESGGEAVTGEFVTAPAETDRATVTFLWSGDLGGGGFCRAVDGGYRIFRAMVRPRPDFFLFVGDTIYADHVCNRPGLVPGSGFVATSLAQFRAKHRYNREDPAVQDFFRGTSVYAIWDDHEVKNDFAASEPLMPVGRAAFLDYWPITPPPADPTRLYRRFQWGTLLEVFILDTRQYRSSNTDPDGPGKTMLGAAQRRWLLDAVTGSRATWKVVVSSVSLSIPTGRAERRDSWTNANVWGTPQEPGTGFTTERDAILRRFRERGVKNLVFLVTDVHHAELIRHHPTPEFSFHEFVAGPLSASLGRPRPLDAALNPRSLFAYGGVNNFGEVTIEPAHLSVRLVDEDGRVLFSHVIGPE